MSNTPNADESERSVMSECRNGDSRCGGPWAEALPCFACYMDRGKALVVREPSLPVAVRE